MDTEQVVAAASAGIGAGQDLLQLLNEPQANCGPALDGIGESLAEALHATLSFHPDLDTDGRVLLAALEEYLP
jgi:hypothetical protein